MVRKLEANEAQAKKSIGDALQRLEQSGCELEKASQDQELVEERFRLYEGTAERLLSHVNSEEAELCKLLSDTAIKKSVAEEAKAHVEQVIIPLFLHSALFLRWCLLLSLSSPRTPNTQHESFFFFNAAGRGETKAEECDSAIKE